MKDSCRYDAVRKTIVCCILAVPFLFGSSATGDKDAEHARELYAAGVILSLENFIADARIRQPGRVIDAKLHYEESHDSYVYEILILDRQGQVWELEYDAHSGVLIETEKDGD